MRDVFEELAYHFGNLTGMLRRELSGNWFGLLFMLSGLIVQYVTYRLTDVSLLSFISGSAGVISVTYVILAYEQRLYGELIENAFYAVMMIIGMWVWLVHYNRETSEVETKRMKMHQLCFTLAGAALVIIILYRILLSTDDTQPLMDAITTVPAFVGQILLTYRYREQWLLGLSLTSALSSCGSSLPTTAWLLSSSSGHSTASTATICGRNDRHSLTLTV